VLRPGGAFCFAIVHPFDSACQSGAASAVPSAVSRPYLTSRRYEDRFERGGLGITLVSMHRPLSAYTTALFGAGLVITDLRERGEREIPWLLVVRRETLVSSAGQARPLSRRPPASPRPLGTRSGSLSPAVCLRLCPRPALVGR